MTLEEARAFFGQDRYATECTGIEILSASGEETACRLRIDDRHKNAHGYLMGGVYFTLADFTFAIATNSPGENVPAMSANISFLCPPKGDTLYSSSKCLHDGGSTCVWVITLRDEEGNETATVTFTGFKKRRKGVANRTE